MSEITQNVIFACV